MEKENIPKETETIKARRAVRITEKVLKGGSSFITPKAWWSGIIEIAIVATIFIVNFYLVYPFFGTAAPNTTFSGPVIPLMAKTVAFFGTPYAYSIQIVNIFFFLTLPLSVYIFAKSISQRKIVGFLSALFISMPFYPFAKVRVDASFLGGDTAHIASLALMPIAIVALLYFLKKGGVASLVIASISSACVALISPFGFMTYLIFALIASFSELLLGNGRLKMTRLAVDILIAGGLNSFWYNLAFFFWMLTGPLGEDMRVTISKVIPITFFTIPVLGAFGYLLFDRKPSLQPLFLASFFSISFLMISIAGGGVFPSHPSRYVHEFGFALSYTFAIVIVGISDYIRFSNMKILARFNKRFISQSLLGVGLVASVLLIFLLRGNLVYYDYSVLGIWDDVEKGRIWEAKDRFQGPYSFLGFSITGVSVFGLSFMAIKEKRWRAD